MANITPELISAQAVDLRGVTLDASRAEQIAADMARLNEAVLATRERLDFNDEPARFAALLNARPAPVRKRK